jgi:type III restriction enzyme
VELKKYQKKVLDDLDSYLSFLNQADNISTAYTLHWNSLGVRVGFNGMPPYNDTIPGVPHVCFKVPTGGGKTFLACCAIRHIYDAMPSISQRVIVWLVPSNAILEQTVRNLGNPQHPYHQRLQQDFDGKIVVLNKEQLLNGQNFTPSSVAEQVSVCIMSFDSLRSAKKDGRKVYQQNGNLKQFAAYYDDPSILLADTDETALIQVLRYLNPVVIVDESHNAQSDLSVEMLNNLNPCFVLDLTATPKSNSNVISSVDANKLKAEDMVKLPVVVFNRATAQDVVLDAIKFRGCIEAQAKNEQATSDTYIRPIVLFQAQAKGNENSTTFEKLKRQLVDKGIPEEQIAIKTAEINELKNIDLQSPECPIRYIITINALKEGWDCPFAYILATLANKSSDVDVQQIVGRILRQPYAHTYTQDLLNTSYVLTSSNKFYETVQKLIDGLKFAGFSKKDYRLGNAAPDTEPEQPPADTAQTSSSEESISKEDVLSNLDPHEVHQALNGEKGDSAVERMVTEQKAAVKSYQHEIQEQENSGMVGGELGSMMNQIQFQPSVAETAESLLIPQFCIGIEPNLLNKYTLLAKENLSEGFSLNQQPADVNFETTKGDAVLIDLKKGDEVPKYKQMQNRQLKWFEKSLSRKAPDDAKQECARALTNSISGKKKNTIPEQDIFGYVLRVLNTVDANQISIIGGSLPFYATKIKERIDQLEDEYRQQLFKKLLMSKEIFCKPTYKLPKVIAPTKTIDSIDNSLYTEEFNDMNNFELETISRVSSCDILWWHRIIERKRKPETEFCINGFINYYPDFMIYTKKRNLVLLETKGSDRDNTNSKEKLYLGNAWASSSGDKFQHFMVFDQDVQMEGSLTLDEFIGILKKL